MAEGGEPVRFNEEEHRAIQQTLNAGQQSEDDQFMRKDPVQMRKKASSLDVLFQGPDIKGFFKQREYSYIAWGTLIVLLIAILLQLIVMAAPGWGWTREISSGEIREGEMYGKYGLWYVCWELVEAPGTYADCVRISELGVPGWFNGVQVMTVFSMLATLIAMANSAAYICAKSMNGNPKLIASVVVLSCIGAVFAIVSFVLFAVQFLMEAYWCCKNGKMQIIEWHLHYCFIICCCVPAFCMASAILAAMEVARLRAIVRKQQYANELDQNKRRSGHYEGYGNPYHMGYGYGYGYGPRQPDASAHYGGYPQGRPY